MNTPNWQHHSKKERKRKLKPQALRAAKERRRQLINRLLNRPQRRFSSMIGTSNEKTHGSSKGNQVTTCQTSSH